MMEIFVFKDFNYQITQIEQDPLKVSIINSGLFIYIRINNNFESEPTVAGSIIEFTPIIGVII